MKKDKKDILKGIKSRREFLLALFIMIKERHKWWLLPLLILLAILSLFTNILKGGTILPAIYTFF
ncbi:MAG: hypothetical protein JW788_05935 [Candidatus Omnitrophica bacterium]|nr:hypothetical protein [Candidatus Omnitrophota bacterium]